MAMQRSLSFGAVLFCLLCSALRAEVRLPALFTSHMVIQRDKPVRVWGWSAPAEKISVTFRGETEQASADNFGRWQVFLRPAGAGGPFDLTVQGSNSITLEDVMAGDVWIASGQSNMEFPMTDLRNADKQIAAASCPDVRLFRVEHKASEYPLEDVIARPWAQCGPETVAPFSAVAYFFAKEISEHEHVTVGVVEASWGGTLAESWTSLEALSSDAGLMPVFAARARMMQEWTDRLAQQKWAEDATSAGKTVPQQTWNPSPAMWEPAALWNGMIAPLTRFAVRGVIWYQGESNSKLDRAPLYGKVFTTLIRDWRRQWSEGDFPFLFVQISSFKSDATENWPEVRAGQVEALSLANTAMAVSIDVGDPDDVHPKDKHPVGHRLALGAEAVAYGEKLEYAGPLFRQATVQGSSVRVWFDHADGLRTSGGVPLGFEIAGPDGKFVAAQAKAEGSTILVTAAGVAHPCRVRYAWANSPAANMFNAAGLPMSPFLSPKCSGAYDSVVSAAP